MINFLFLTFFLFSCSSKQIAKQPPNMVDHDLLKELCQLERNYAKKYEKKSTKELDKICKL